MSNPVYRLGPITKEAATKVEQGRLVTIDGEGKVKHAAASGAIFGAVTEKRDPDNVLSAKTVAVHYGPAVVRLAVEGDAAAIKAGAAVYAAADGKAAASGEVQVGVAVEDGANDRVLTVLNSLPIAG